MNRAGSNLFRRYGDNQDQVQTLGNLIIPLKVNNQKAGTKPAFFL